MEKNNGENKRNWLKTGVIAAGLGFATLLAAGCGQTDPPTPQELNKDMEYVKLDGVIAADGGPVWCAVYGQESTGTNDSKSWFAYSCDFDGGAQFPSETPITVKPS